MNKKKTNTIYIISKGRPQCRTALTLEKMNYTGEWFIVCGNNDEDLAEYQSRWGKDRVLVFDWYEQVKHSNLLDNFGVETMSSGAVPVRNAVRKISADRGEVRHWQFDDDYTSFYHINRTMTKNRHIVNGASFEKELNRLSQFAYEADLGNVGFCLGHEAFPDGCRGFSKRVFNAHNMSSEKDKFVEWRGRMNDDVINAIDVYNSGKTEMSFKHLSLILKPTQSEDGGNTDIYQLSGTVRKTAYAIMICPLAVKLIVKFGRYHHEVAWRKIYPKLIREKYAKV